MGVGDHHFVELVLGRKCKCQLYGNVLVVLQLSVVDYSTCGHLLPIALDGELGGPKSVLVVVSGRVESVLLFIEGACCLPKIWDVHLIICVVEMLVAKSPGI